MNALQGIATVEIGGAHRPIKFGTNQTSIFCQTRNITLKQYGEELNGEKLAENDIDPALIRDFIHSALAAGALSNGLPADFTPFQVGDWIDEVEPSELEKIFQTATAANGPNGNRSQKRAALKKI